MEKLKFGDRITIRSIELQVLTDTYENEQYYFLSKGRSLLDTLGIMKEDEYELANRFSQVPRPMVERNPIGATSLINLQTFVDYVIEASNLLPLTPDEIKKIKMMELYKKIDKFHPTSLFYELFEANEKMLMKVTELEKKVFELENNLK